MRWCIMRENHVCTVAIYDLAPLSQSERSFREATVTMQNVQLTRGVRDPPAQARMPVWMETGNGNVEVVSPLPYFTEA